MTDACAKVIEILDIAALEHLGPAVTLGRVEHVVDVVEDLRHLEPSLEEHGTILTWRTVTLQRGKVGMSHPRQRTWTSRPESSTEPDGDLAIADIARRPDELLAMLGRGIVEGISPERRPIQAKKVTQTKSRSNIHPRNTILLATTDAARQLRAMRHPLRQEQQRLDSLNADVCSSENERNETLHVIVTDLMYGFIILGSNGENRREEMWLLPRQPWQTLNVQRLVGNDGEVGKVECRESAGQSATSYSTRAAAVLCKEMIDRLERHGTGR